MRAVETERAVALIRKVRQGRTPIMIKHDMGVVFDSPTAFRSGLRADHR
jgi:hypothetical protein